MRRREQIGARAPIWKERFVSGTRRFVWFLVLAAAWSAPVSAKESPSGRTPAEPTRLEGEIPITTSSSDSRRLYLEAEHLFDVGRESAGREKLREAVRLDPRFARAYVKLVEFAPTDTERHEQLEKAAASLEGKSAGERLLVELYQAQAANDLERAHAIGHELVASYPKSPRAWIRLARLEEGRSENLEARTAASRALEIDPGSAGALFLLIGSYLYQPPTDPTTAERYARRFVETLPGEAAGFELLGDALRAENDLEGSLAAYSRATEIDPGLVLAQFKKGHVSSFQGDLDGASRAYKSAIDAAPPDLKATLAMIGANRYLYVGDLQGTLDELIRLADSVEAMGTPPSMVEELQVQILTAHATAALYGDQLDQAAASIARRNALERAIGEKLGDADDERLRQFDCEIWDGMLAAHRGDAAAARAHAEAARELVANDANPRRLEPYYRLLGTVALRSGDAEQAAALLRKADFGGDLLVRYDLARAEEASGHPEEARKLYLEVSKWNFNSVGFALTRSEAAARAAGLSPRGAPAAGNPTN
jgi:tetratricopeptide (TPR) repeat protein